MFDSVDPNQSFPDLELGILQYWKEEDIFKRSIQRRKGNDVFSFYDGPPFATGLPHYGHILAGTIKDVIPRYQTMRGKFVKRRFGWDCHGLPVENEIEKEQGLKSKKDIEALGIAAFNDLCRNAVQRYTNEWRTTVERMGRFVDMDHDYRTMDPEYMESIWWVFAELQKRDLIYEGWKPMHVCPRCQTPLSNFEVTQGYKDIQDYSVTAMFLLKEAKEGKETKEPKEKVYFLAWTTTAWTLPGNLFLAVNPNEEYVKFWNQEKNEERKYYITSRKYYLDLVKKKCPLLELTNDGEDFASTNIDGSIELPGSSKRMMGSELINVHYTPLFPYYEEEYKDQAFRVVGGDFVTTTDGTGIVHIATGYGEDDFAVGKREKVAVLQHVGIDGLFKKEVIDFAGKSAKPRDDHQSGDKMIAKWLKDHGKLFKAETFNHSYPHCWRCDSPLLNYATSSWFVAVEKIKKKMLESNAKTAWVPAHIRDGRFGKWLEGARDWAISRSRFWGTPLPLWKNTLTGEVEVIRSRDQLMQKRLERFTKVLVMRHAESQGNVDAIYQGKVPGTPLTARGQEQAAALAEQVGQSEVPVSVIYCSPLLRTQETAKAVALKTGAPIIIDERLCEVDFGAYESKHVDFDDLTFIREKRAHKLETKHLESIYHFDGMETWPSITRRMNDFLDEVLPKHKGQAIAIVTHADLVMNAVHIFTGESPDKIVHQPYPGLAGLKTFFWDHERKAQMDLHKETVDTITWNVETKSKKATVDLTLMRHGETDFNKQRLVQGTEVDMPLNKTGKAQAKKAAEGLGGQQFDVIISSDLRRAAETAKIVSKELGIPYSGSFEIFRERSLGVLSGKPIDDALQAYPDPLNKISLACMRATPPNGESLDQFIGRTRKAHDFLLKEYSGKKVLVVAHGGFNRAFLMVAKNLSYTEMLEGEQKNAQAVELKLVPQMRRIEEVLDCWFESGSMPYAQEHFPFESLQNVPPSFPADFIAEGLDQTRGWFYTLMVLSTALFDCPAFKNCIVNGIVLAEDGKKMSKRLKNYPEPMEIVKKHGADAVRFALMSSPAVRGEDLRFSENLVTEVTRSVLLPLWHAYRLFVTYANAADWKPSLDFSLKNAESTDILDRWMILKTQALVDAMTKQLDAYDLSATCAELSQSIDDLTNWYVRLSRRRFAGKEEGIEQALDTLHRVLVCHSQLLAPFCPFISDTMYQNLVAEEHGSVHLTNWPPAMESTAEDRMILQKMDQTRTIVTLGLALRSDAKIRVRQPLQSVTFALPPSDTIGVIRELIAEELNVKQVIDIPDASALATRIVRVDARKVGPRVGGKVQAIIQAGKAGQFEEKDGNILILGETLTSEEAKVVYESKEGRAVLAEAGMVVSIDTTMTDALLLEGQARELIHTVQQLRKDEGLAFTDAILLEVTGVDDVLGSYGSLIEEETRATFGTPKKGKKVSIDLGEKSIDVRFEKN